MIEHIEQGKHLFVVGLSYEKANSELRGLFNISEDLKEDVFKYALGLGVDSLLIISTCNRTELYAFAHDKSLLIDIFCKYSNGNKDLFDSISYTYTDQKAITHLYEVGCGLKSQILGDFEIIGQLKKAVRSSKKNGVLSSFFERLTNSVMQASKTIKNSTLLSDGAASVSFAAANYIIKNVDTLPQKTILLYGMGKMGKNTCENLVKHTTCKSIKLYNRTVENAEKFAGKMKLDLVDPKDITEQINLADILIVSTSSTVPLITVNDIYSKRDILILDLSIPRNVDHKVQEMKNITYLDVDQISKIVSSTLKNRESQIPLAKEIIQEHKKDFLEWVKTRKFAPTINAFRDMLNDIKYAEIDFLEKKMPSFNKEDAHLISSRMIQRITTQIANHIIKNDGSSIDIINNVFDLKSTKKVISPK
ncbi:glutamyl-tRNA reductase [Ichthyobacterium seriolicida]|uniref:Glutamyl-tRNA reductase n=1 Tax=Ichthyobacterium seriolicida TaxID=242600 RepID=A0A1J1E9J1_9FLAO|nr:glutamyl-tRNA reductase [Ichthyobacterium seriolicida]BAV94571.1 glutamyl-tRNA reductase [Ichthyobacterium seriolicida]